MASHVTPVFGCPGFAKILPHSLNPPRFGLTGLSVTAERPLVFGRFITFDRLFAVVFKLSAIPDFDKGTDGLLPTIAQDSESGRVLMLAWMNREAWLETLASGSAVYFSRSREKLWRKGDTSGHRQRVVEIRVDCDADTILLRVEQTGAACHAGYESCFFRSIDCAGQAKIVDTPLVDPRQVYPDRD